MTDYFQNLVVGNNNKRVNIFFQLFQTLFRLNHTLTAFKIERLGYDTNRQASEFLGNLCEHRRSTGSGSAAKSGSQEYHVSPFHCLTDFFFTLYGSLTSVIRVSTSSKSCFSKLNLVLNRRNIEGLKICVRHIEFNTLNTFLNHAVNCVSARTADSEHFDLSYLVVH